MKRKESKSPIADFCINFLFGALVGGVGGFYAGFELFETDKAIAAAGMAGAVIIGFLCAIWGEKAWSAIFLMLESLIY